MRTLRKYLTEHAIRISDHYSYNIQLLFSWYLINLNLKLNIWETKIMASVPITSWQIDGETMETVTDFNLWAPKSLQMVTTAMKLKMLAPWENL